MDISSFVNGFLELETLRDQPEACLQAAPIGVREGEVARGVVLDPHTYEGLLRLAIAYRQQQPEEAPPQVMSETLAAFIDMGERLLGERSTGIEDDEGHSDPNPDDQAPS